MELATHRDIPRLVALINRAYEVESFFVSTPRTDAVEVAALLADGSFLQVSREGGQLLGCVYVAPRPDARAYLGLLSVHPEAQGQGMGRRLVALAEEHARGLGARVMELRVVDLRSELLGWYGALGYAPTGQVDLPDASAHQFTRPIRFLQLEKVLG